MPKNHQRASSQQHLDNNNIEYLSEKEVPSPNCLSSLFGGIKRAETDASVLRESEMRLSPMAQRTKSIMNDWKLFNCDNNVSESISSNVNKLCVQPGHRVSPGTPESCISLSDIYG